MSIVLASSSPYKRQLIEKLGLSVQTCSPDIDETPTPEEAPSQLAQRLSEAKAKACADDYPDHLIIGSDQVAELNGHIMGKPGDFTKARQQLLHSSGRIVTFYTGISIYSTRTGHQQYAESLYQVKFRNLSEAQITNYLQREEPYDCAGSFKSEGLGIALFEYIRGDDPNSLIGLPLIELINMLNHEGVDVLG